MIGPRRPILALLLRTILAAALLPLAPLAQPILAPPPEPIPAPTAESTDDADPDMEIIDLDDRWDVGEEMGGLLRWGPVQLRPHANYRFIYGNNIGGRSGGGGQESTALHSFSPGIAAVLSRYAVFDYTLTLNEYSNSAFQDSIDHQAALTGQYNFRQVSLSFSQTAAKTSTPQVETGGQVEQKSFGTQLGAYYDHSSKTSLEFTLRQNIRLTDRFNDQMDWLNLNWLDYQIRGKTSIGIGAGVGFTDVSDSPDMLYQQILGRVGYAATAKISLGLDGGVEFRQFHGSDRSAVVNPVFGASATYRPFDGTQFSLTANRAVHASYFSGQIVTRTSLGLSARQRFFQKYYWDVGGDIGFSEYEGSAAGVDPNRSDDYLRLSTSVSREIFQKGAISVFYQYSKNDSGGASPFSFTSHQGGVQVGYAF